MPQHHNGIVIAKDGLQPDKPPLVEVEWVGDVEGTAISRSRVPSYNGTDWDRTNWTCWTGQSSRNLSWMN